MSEIVFGQESTFNQIWHTPLAPAQYFTILGFSIFTALCLISFFVWGLTQQKHFDPRYQVSVRAGLTLTAVASLSYLLILYKLIDGYSLINGLYQPADGALMDVPARYIDWSISVPLLVAELIGVSALSMVRATRLRLVGGASALAMILCGYMGETVTPDGLGGRVSWGIASSIFFVIVYGIIIYTVFKSRPELSARENTIYRRAMGVLLAAWFIYPIIYGFNGFNAGSGWATAAQVGYCIADVIAKVGFGLLVFKLVRLRSERSKAHA